MSGLKGVLLSTPTETLSSAENIKMDNIYLVGFMGTGKTVVGKEVARRLNQGFIDLDSLIEEKQKRKISEIFAQEGEAYFRNLENESLKQISKKRNVVVSCGGGIVKDLKNIKVMKDTGVIICLNASPEVIIARTRGHIHRPLLNVDNPQEKIQELLRIRAPFYARADSNIDTSNLVISSVVNKVLRYVRAKNP